jgi:hypothetical protein
MASKSDGAQLVISLKNEPFLYRISSQLLVTNRASVLLFCFAFVSSLSQSRIHFVVKLPNHLLINMKWRWITQVLCYKHAIEIAPIWNICFTKTERYTWTRLTAPLLSRLSNALRNENRKTKCFCSRTKVLFWKMVHIRTLYVPFTDKMEGEFSFQQCRCFPHALPLEL